MAGRPTKFEATKKALNTKTPSNIKQEIDRLQPVGKSRSEFYCVCCGDKYDKQKDNFPTSQSNFFKGNAGFLPICNNCFDSATEQYEELLGNQEKAIERMCLHWDMYFSDEILAASKKISADRSRVKTYNSKANLIQWQGKTYDTTLSEKDNNAINSLDDLNDIKEKSDINVTKNSVKIWGFGFSPEDYEFLNTQFSDWKAKCVIEGKPKETLVRELCVLKLQQNKALLERKIDLYTKLTESHQKTLDRASLTPKIEEATDRAGEVPMGMMIDRYENDKPIPKPNPEWEDVDGIIKMFSIYFLGHLCKMLNLKNKYSKMYEDEMARYRVEIPELENADDDEVFEFLSNESSDE